MKNNYRLDPLGAPELLWLDDGRLRVVRKYRVIGDTQRAVRKKDLFLPWGTLDREAKDAPAAFLFFDDCVLCEQRVDDVDRRDGADKGRYYVLTRVFEEAADAQTLVGYPEMQVGEDGIVHYKAVYVNKSGESWTAGVVGTDTATFGGQTYILEKEVVEETHGIRRATRTYCASGIIEAVRRQRENALMSVLFTSVGAKATPTALNGAAFTDNIVSDHTGGTASLVIREDVRNVKGLNVWTVEILLKSDGSALTGNDDLLMTYADWVDYRWPGCVDATSAKGFVLTPPVERVFKATVNVYLTYGQTSSLTAAQKPYRVQNWATANLNFTPVITRVGVAKSASFPGYLAGTGFAAISGEVMGMDVLTAVGTVNSSPMYADFTILGKVIENKVHFLLSLAGGAKLFLRRVITIDATQTVS